jgi:serine/threonine-protein kinase RsbW
MPESVVKLSFPAKAEYLVLARLALAGMARTMPVGPELLADLKLAVTEACGNAVRHAYGAEAGVVRLAFILADDRLQMTVEDEGAGIDSATALLASPDGSSERPTDGGMGISIMRAIVDELDVRSGPGGAGTVVRMTKYFEPAAAGGAG